MNMKKIILIPDSFKGTMSSIKICEILKEAVLNHFEQCEVISIPVADGGEGSVDCLLAALGGKKVKVNVSGPYMEKMIAFYGIVDSGKTAVIEMAACAGLPLVEGRKNPLLTTTYGVGELMLAAAKRGCKKIIMCLGGSCTNDLGAGAAAAAGIRFLDENGTSFTPTGGTLHKISAIDTTKKSPLLNNVEIVTMCDIDNPLYGNQGAAYVFAAQKGADKAAQKLLDNGLRHAAEKIEADIGVDVSALHGAGAAGGMGAGLVAFFNSTLQMGIETILDTVNFSKLVCDADFVFTGEGKLDEQSLRGKVVIGVAKRAKEKGVPVIAIVGDYCSDLSKAYEQGVSAVFSTNRLAKDFSVVKKDSQTNLKLCADNVLRLIKASSK